TNVQIDQLLHGFGSEKTATQRFFRENNLAQKRLHFATKPVADWNAKTHLASREILARQQLAQYLFQEILARQSSQLQILRETRSKLNNLMVQERRSCFQRHRHRRDINFDQQIVRQVSHLIRQQHRVDHTDTVGAL